MIAGTTVGRQAGASAGSSPAPPTATSPPPPAPQPPPVARRPSVALGSPTSGRLLRGVRLRHQGEHHFTWDPVRRTTPNRGWRRYGTDTLVETTLAVIADFRSRNPGAPRIGVGDLSRPRGGGFGPRFGARGHASHQNGLDVDVYYPRRDGRERAARTPAQVDRPLAQELVDLFVGSGARFVFVGQQLRLAGPRRVVQAIPFHDDHLHVRIRP